MSTSVNQTVLAKGWERFTAMHWGYLGFLVNSHTNRLEELHPLMNFNKSFPAYNTIDSTLCQTNVKRQSQKDAALEAVQTISLNQIEENEPAGFSSSATKEMFFRRL